MSDTSKGDESTDPAAKYHLKFEEYVPLQSEQAMRSYSNPMTGSKPPQSVTATTSKSAQAPSAPPPALPQRPRKESQSRQRAPPTPASPTRGRFVPISNGGPTSPDFAYGVIHLYRDVSEAKDAEIKSAVNSSGSPEEENVLGILAVPSYMTANDFMGFVGEKQPSQVSHFRMIRTEAANRYMVLFKFRTNEAAKEFHKLFNGKEFNSMEAYLFFESN